MIRGLTVLDVFTCIRGLFRWHGTWFPDELACLQEAKGWCHHIVSWCHDCRPVKFCKHSVWKVKLWKAVKAAESSYGKPHLVSAATENLMRLKRKSKPLLESCDHGAVSGIMDNSNPWVHCCMAWRHRCLLSLPGMWAFSSLLRSGLQLPCAGHWIIGRTIEWSSISYSSRSF